MKPIVAILVGHHGLGTGSSFKGRDEWLLATEDAIELCRQLYRDGIIEPRMESIERDNDPDEQRPILRSARWALSQKPAAVIELHYNSFEITNCDGHTVKANRLTPFVDCMARALDALPNRRRDTEINVGMKLCNLVEPIPSVLIEPAFIFNDIIMTPEWRPQLVAAIKHGLYKYFEGEENNA